MPKPPRVPLGGANDPARPLRGDPDLYKQEIPSGWLDAIYSGNLAAYTAIRVTDFLDGIAEGINFALESPGKALTFAAVELYDAAGSIWDATAPAIGSAITDISKKVIEEGWFGREVTPREIDVTREPPSVETRMGFRELVAMQAAMLPTTPEQADPARHEPEIDGPSM